jgi:hypothetical protein
MAIMMREKVNELNAQLRELVNFGQFGFKDLEQDIFFYSWKLKREISKKIDIVSYGFSKDKWGDDMFLHPINSYIVFEEVNKILLDVKNDNSSFYLHEPLIVELPNFDKKNTENYYDISRLLFIKNRTLDEQLFDKALNIFKEQLETSVLPFFDRIQTLQQINDEILEKYEWIDWNNYISGQTYFKALIILKLCNNDNKYNEFKEFYKERIDKAIKEGHVEHRDYYTFLIQLLDYLESDRYLEIYKT